LWIVGKTFTPGLNFFEPPLLYIVSQNGKINLTFAIEIPILNLVVYIAYLSGNDSVGV